MTFSVKGGIIALDKVGRKAFAEADYENIKYFRASNLAVREWYKGHVDSIPEQIDRSQPLETQAKQAHGLRNLDREQARNLMADQAERARLDVISPILSFEEFVSQKMADGNMGRKEVLEYMLGSSARTNATVNRSLGLEV